MLIDFTAVRQCWLAAFWAAQALEANFEKPVSDEAASVEVAADPKTLGDQGLMGQLAVYDSARVLPVLVFPVYAWLLEALCELVREVGRYHQVDAAVQEFYQRILLGDEPWRQINTSGSEIASEDAGGAGGGVRLFNDEWAWLTYFWQSQGDNLSGFVLDVKEIRQCLPLGGASLQGGVCFRGGAQAQSVAMAEKSASKEKSALDRTISTKHLPAWCPSTAVARVELVQDLLRELGDRWVES